jgi:hypothetical protein
MSKTLIAGKTKFQRHVEKLRSAESKACDAFLHIADELQAFRDDEESWKERYPTWKECCESDQVGYSYPTVKRICRAADIRRNVVTGARLPGPWNVQQLEQLARLPTNTDIKAMARKVQTRINKGGCGYRQVKGLVDEAMGVVRKAAEKKDAELLAASTPAEVIEDMRAQVVVWQSSLAKVPGDFWTDAESDRKGCVKRLSNALSELSSYLLS